MQRSKKVHSNSVHCCVTVWKAFCFHFSTGVKLLPKLEYRTGTLVLCFQNSKEYQTILCAHWSLMFMGNVKSEALIFWWETKKRTDFLMKKLSTPVPFLPSVAPPALQQPFHQSFYKSECFVHWVLYFSCSLRCLSAIPPPQQINSCSSFPGFVSVWVPFLRMERDCQFLPAAFVVHGS